MNEDLKWSNYDFTKIPFDDIVSVGQRTLLYRDLFTVSWLLGRFCNYKCSYARGGLTIGDAVGVLCACGYVGCGNRTKPTN